LALGVITVLRPPDQDRIRRGTVAEAAVPTVEGQPDVAEPAAEASAAVEEPLVEADLLVEDVSIDGMCGVY
jgi:mycofactocin precursor